LPVDANLRRIAENSKAISIGHISDLRLLLPEGYAIVDDPRWVSTSASRLEFQYVGELQNGRVVKVKFRQVLPSWQTWLRANSMGFVTFFFVSFIAIITIYNVAITHGFNPIAAKIAIGITVALLALYVITDFNTGGPQGKFEKNWWLISFIA